MGEPQLHGRQASVRLSVLLFSKSHIEVWNQEWLLVPSAFTILSPSLVSPSVKRRREPLQTEIRAERGVQSILERSLPSRLPPLLPPPLC